MSLKIRLSRWGAKKRPYYRVVIADSRSPRDGKFLDRVGSWDPMQPKDSGERVKLDLDKIKEWMAKGATPTDRVARFIHQLDASLVKWTPSNNPNKAKPGQKAQDRITEKAEKVEAKKAAAEEAKSAPKVEAPAETPAAEAAPAEAETAAEAPTEEAKPEEAKPEEEKTES